PRAAGCRRRPPGTTPLHRRARGSRPAAGAGSRTRRIAWRTAGNGASWRVLFEQAVETRSDIFNRDQFHRIRRAHALAETYFVDAFAEIFPYGIRVAVHHPVTPVW